MSLYECDMCGGVPGITGCCTDKQAMTHTRTEQPEALAAIKTLQQLGYTYHGGEQWKPPRGKPINFNLVDSLHARIQELEGDMRFVERWAVHHGTKPGVSAEEVLSCVQHYPGIQAITDSYTDGKRPETFDPYQRIKELEAELASIKAAEPPDFNLNTPTGGRGFVAWYFANVLHRHDYEKYITNRLAVDFACDLAKALRATQAAKGNDK